MSEPESELQHKDRFSHFSECFCWPHSPLRERGPAGNLLPSPVCPEPANKIGKAAGVFPQWQERRQEGTMATTLMGNQNNKEPELERFAEIQAPQEPAIQRQQEDGTGAMEFRKFQKSAAVPLTTSPTDKDTLPSIKRVRLFQLSLL
ncbi:hypothetical protein MG293_007846 [Ovis ammon polii]|uniref:Uncharacterized protein n=1 Tax=Ovis ammon polii TaxID=230172 RepID=A0AAD4UD73_OVIAM|nr:hypothetical protein MG293_007846 [Ovis ammon polii]KAI4573777.1 hypothetical protein MJT46_005017 [Ovis ammon polii x Ovis aries]